MFKSNYISALLTATALTAVLATPAAAQSVEDLQKQINMLQKQIEKLAKAQAKSPKVKKSEPAMSLSTPDGLHTFNIRGRIYTDYVKVSDRNNTMDQSGTEFRTARLGIEGKAWKDVKYKFEADFSGNEVTVKDAYMQFGTMGGKVTVGQFKTPNSLDEQTSSRHISFMERGSFTDAFGFARQTGVMYGTGDKTWTFKAGVFKGNNEDAGNGDTTFAARATYGASMENGKWIVGGSMRSRKTDGQFRYRQRPHVHLADRPVNTGHIGNGDDFFYGIEAGTQWGSFHAAGEYGVLKAKDVTLDGGNANLTGGYAEIGYFLTGEKRSLKLNKGAWDRPGVNNPINEGGMGAFQINARYDTLDMTGGGARGGEMDTWIVGLNWWMTRHTRMVLNYSHSSIDKAWAVGSAIDGKNSVNALGLRFQIDW